MAYQIICTPNYYSGTQGAPQEHFLRCDEFDDDPSSDTHDIAEWETHEEAQAFIDDLTGEVYHCSHGEAGRPSYEICEDLAFSGDDCLECDGDEVDGDMINPEELPDGIRGKLDNLNVREYSYHSNYDVYTAAWEHDGREYAIVFCPRTLAIMAADGDLGNLDWDHAGYFILND